MKFVNTSRCIVTIGNATIYPFTVTRDYSEKELKENDKLNDRIKRGILVEFTGKIPARPSKVAYGDPRFEVEQTFEEGKKVTQIRNGKPVTYVVADSEGVDGVAMSDDEMHTSSDGRLKTSPDYIETGIDAGKFKNGADAMEAELNKECAESNTDDSDNLAEHESDRGEPMDLDYAEAEDHAQMVRKNGKFGADVTTAKAQIQTEITRGLNEVNKTLSETLDEGEPTDMTGKVADLLSKPYNAKKYMIAKENDKQFLTSVESTTQSEAVKNLVKQRISELK